MKNQTGLANDTNQGNIVLIGLKTWELEQEYNLQREQWMFEKCKLIVEPESI